MKKVQQKLKRRAGIVGMICLLAASLSSCVKDHDYYNSNNSVDVTPAALISVIDASPDAPSLDFYLDANKANRSPIVYNDGLDYLAAYIGKRTATFYSAGTKTVVKSDTITLNANRYYTLYLANLASKPDYLLTRDTLVQPAAGMATIRLVNVSPDAPALDLGIRSGALLASNKTYRTYSSFVSIAAGTNYTVEVRQHSNSAVLSSLINIKLNAGSVYTIWAHGLIAGTGATLFSADIQKNAYYY
ncbi:uncharacterized protein DUF4397 [Mucilaginibacter gracilis]|uniref:Uncharacterized protein DUF4397 n=1 Tax=Mucilaginibacter gracilis TaxID=423350 RepID=A0A495J430_9SPHI|nr:DUF4397 domain-containing protein [Mucilaginibacter gracilis]RKR83441.1 uncharacterized protein DUF4397 [Mucilaginibacter gracilis]